MATLVYLGVLALIVLADLLPLMSRRPRASHGLEPAAEEAALATMLLTGLIGPAEYQRRMARLAASDALRHPVVVPPGQS